DDPDPGADRLRALLRVPVPDGTSARYGESDMTSGKKARKQRRTPAPPPVRSTGAMRASPKVLAVGAGVIALAAVAAALAFALTGGSSSSSPTTAAGTLPDAGSAVQLFTGIPQHGNVLGKASAPVTMVEYIDLQ